VQKVFGLPAGLGVLILSPKAIEKEIRAKGEMAVNSFKFHAREFKRLSDGHYTPNVLGSIYSIVC